MPFVIYKLIVFIKKIFLPILLFFTVVSANAQVKYGLKAGINFANTTMKMSGMSFSPEAQTSFHLTGFADIAINEKFSFQPGLSFQGKGYKLDIRESGYTQKDNTNLSYLEIPLNGVLYLPLGDGKLFIGAGPYVAFGLFGKSKYESNSVAGLNGDEDAKFGNSKDDHVAPIDLGLNFMVGYQFKSGLLFNAGYGLGLANTVPKDLREGGLKGNNKVFSLSVGYAF